MPHTRFATQESFWRKEVVEKLDQLQEEVATLRAGERAGAAEPGSPAVRRTSGNSSDLDLDPDSRPSSPRPMWTAAGAASAAEATLSLKISTRVVNQLGRKLTPAEELSLDATLKEGLVLLAPAAPPADGGQPAPFGSQSALTESSAAAPGTVLRTVERLLSEHGDASASGVGAKAVAVDEHAAAAPVLAVDASALLGTKFSCAVEEVAGAQLFACVLEAMSAPTFAAADGTPRAQEQTFESLKEAIHASISDHAYRAPVVATVKSLSRI